MTTGTDNKIMVDKIRQLEILTGKTAWKRLRGWWEGREKNLKGLTGWGLGGRGKGDLRKGTWADGSHRYRTEGIFK